MATGFTVEDEQIPTAAEGMEDRSVIPDISSQSLPMDQSEASSKPSKEDDLLSTASAVMVPVRNKLDKISADMTDEEVQKLIKQFDIQRFLSKLLQDEYSFKTSGGQNGNRFRVFFAHMFIEVTKISRPKYQSQYSAYMKERLTDLEKLLFTALHSLDENFELWFDIAYNAEYRDIVHLLPDHSQSVSFYEAMVNASKRHSKLQYGIMLSAFGNILRTIYKRVLEAYDQFMKALDVLAPLGDGIDLAQLYNRIGGICLMRGMYNNTTERYV